ncbi:carbon storage regulator CsrA [Jeotgalibacillus marinus]|uniref:Translational regulator CsrA n=1 Tax=Jeotgalibacillus marinus TaxID=86667 RepID=A0ABV3Q4H9_9BACL
MLVLRRKLNESIMIGDNIEVKILEMDGDQIKLGIEAPTDIDIFRSELYKTIQQENNLAATQEIDLSTLFNK